MPPHRSVILSAAKNLVSRPRSRLGEKILRCAQNDRRRSSHIVTCFSDFAAASLPETMGGIAGDRRFCGVSIAQPRGPGAGAVGVVGAEDRSGADGTGG